MKIATVLGARPQFIKASVVSAALAAAGVDEIVVHTGQHFDPGMSDVFFDELGMAPPAHHLGIHGGSHGVMTGRMLAEIESLLARERPDAVLVYGDTNSTMAGALAAVKLHMRVAHVEAGLRSFNMRMPEEINRIVTDRVSTWLFTPTEVAAAHLRREGLPADQIIPVGDVMYDVALQHGARAGDGGALFARYAIEPRGYVLATVHRAENTDDRARLEAIADGLRQVAARTRVVWPLHPRTRLALGTAGLLHEVGRAVTLIDPVGYLDMVRLERHAAAVATDSGGVQKEAFFHRVPCVTLRDETEWTELVDSGWNRLAPPRAAGQLADAITAAIGSRGADVAPYGDGRAAARIAAHLARHS